MLNNTDLSWPQAFLFAVIAISLCSLFAWMFWVAARADEKQARLVRERPPVPLYTYRQTTTYAKDEKSRDEQS